MGVGKTGEDEMAPIRIDMCLVKVAEPGVVRTPDRPSGYKKGSGVRTSSHSTTAYSTQTSIYIFVFRPAYSSSVQ